MIAIYLLAIIGLFAVIGGIRQWWINPKRKLSRSIKQMERAERRILLTHKYWTALAHTKLKIFKNENKAL